MKCWIHKKRLYLYRQGEVTAGERRALEKHLDSCEKCREEAVRIQEIEQGSSLLRAEKPALSRPEEMTDSVMRRIRAGIADRPSVRIPVIFGQIPRFAYAVLAAAILGSFFYQEYRVLAKISRLEQRMAGIPGGRGGVHAEPVLDRLPAGLRTAGPITVAGMEKPEWDAGDYWILIKKSELDSLLRVYGDSPVAAVPELEKIHRMLVEWDETKSLSPASVREMDWIIRRRREWLQKIDRL